MVEDNNDDAELTARAFSSARIANKLVRVSDGIEALDYLFGRGAYATRDVRQLPVLVQELLEGARERWLAQQHVQSPSAAGEPRATERH